jgi:hypothetical protein
MPTPTRLPYGNLTAVLAVVALFELVIDRLIGRLFLSPGCQSLLGCLMLRSGPFLLYLTGALAVLVTAGGISGHLVRGELFPRGVRLTIAALSMVFLLLVSLSLVFGQMPERYQTHLQTSFGFVVVLLTLSLLGPGSTAIPMRARVGLLLFALPTVLHIVALLATRAGWLRYAWMNPERLSTWGEGAMLLAAATSPFSLLPIGVPRWRVGAALVLAAGVSVFFFVALLGRTDLVQTIALYSVHLELPRAGSVVGAGYVVALFGFATTLGVLLTSPGVLRLIGLGLALIALAGYQTASPISLSLSLCGLLALGTGTLRAAAGIGDGASPTAVPFRELLRILAATIADAPVAGGDPVPIEESTDDNSGSSTVTVRAARHERPVTIEFSQADGSVRSMSVTVGAPPDASPDATIESHEAWLSRPPESRTTLPRVKTGDPVFDRKMGIYGSAPADEKALRRKILRLADATITLWRGTAARFETLTNPTDKSRRFSQPGGAAGARLLLEVVDTLNDLVQAGEAPTPTGIP